MLYVAEGTSSVGGIMVCRRCLTSFVAGGIRSVGIIGLWTAMVGRSKSAVFKIDGLDCVAAVVVLSFLLTGEAMAVPRCVRKMAVFFIFEAR